MTKEGQKELLNVAHHLRQALVDLTKANISATKAERGSGSDYLWLKREVSRIYRDVDLLQEKVGRAAGPVEKHPGFKCDKADCPVHRKEEV